MPFIGRDWRSPGEAWVKTESLGWQRMKIIESQLHPAYHQTNPACSWPPRSEFGQHMANHCNKEHNRSSCDRNSSDYRDGFSSASSSDCGSRASSISPSPNGSPEKNVHHLHPITISSPYGQYSCCAHHIGDSSVLRLDNKQDAQTTLTRSLSRESVLVDTTNKSKSEMRYNNSVPNFQNSSTSSVVSDQIRLQEEKNGGNIGNLIDESKQENKSKPSTPRILKNGCKLEDSELEGCGRIKDSTPKLEQNLSKLEGQSSSSAACCCALHCQSSQNIYQPKEPYVKTAPHCRISVRTREVAMYNTISEAFYRLDFCNAIHDIRRFNYICKLLHLLITQNLTSLSGCATKVLFTMLEQVAWEVSSNKRNIHVLKNLLNELKQMIQKYYCWGRPIGSSLLWQQHFDTIERISQMVDGIELSPPKSDQTQATFNNLPVEMIREILLRLNDYRDLVNSAQASPVMQNMIDGQYIWQQLCRYHFTDQQVKLALDNNSNGLFTKSSRNTIRGLKYAKTTSADGRTSFRNPVLHKAGKTSGLTTRQQLEQTSGRRNSRQREPGNDNKSSSYVTKTIRIFDKGSSSTPVGSSKVAKNGDSKAPNKVAQSSNQDKDQEIGPQQNRLLNSNRLNHEIDWERVFHQLRKKFDLKEEYADCLLLCRHCRCLFWKSFGHPCIKSDDNNSTIDRHQSANLRLNHQPSCSLASRGQNSCNCDRLHQSSDSSGQEEAPSGARVDGAAVEHASRRDQSRSRMSVAALSRSFDSRAQGSSRDNLENQAPASNDEQRNHSQQQQRQRLHLDDNPDARLRGRHARMWANRRPLDNGEIYNNAGAQNGAAGANNNLAARRNELVPKHVAVSPQAFLKFFSL